MSSSKNCQACSDCSPFACDCNAKSAEPADPFGILEEARGVLSQRQEAYAHPAVNFDRIAKMWSVIAETKLTSKQVALMMIAMKITREMNSYQYDNWLDMIGYAVQGERLKSFTEDMQ